MTSFDITIDEGAFLVKFARKTIETYINNRRKLDLPKEGISKELMKKCGAFVTLNKLVEGHKQLRGCIGIIEGRYSLLEVVRDVAISAAVEDPRFYPVEPQEMKEVVIEVSVLTPPKLLEGKKVDAPKSIEVGKHGLIIESGWYKGLLLPQVATEYSWNAEEFLSQTCIKAGFPPDAWLLPDTRIYAFEAIIFAEEEPKGKVVRLALPSCK